MTSKIFWIKCVLCNCSISEQNVNLLEVEENWVFILSQILLSWHIFVFHWNGILWLNYVLLLEWITYLTYLGSEICPLRDQNWGPKLHPRGGLFGPWSFIISKKSHQNLSNGNEGSNLFLRSLEVGHWDAQTWLFFDELPEITGIFLKFYKNWVSFCKVKSWSLSVQSQNLVFPPF